jgi:hypothetical protein
MIFIRGSISAKNVLVREIKHRKEKRILNFLKKKNSIVKVKENVKFVIKYLF